MYRKELPSPPGIPVGRGDGEHEVELAREEHGLLDVILGLRHNHDGRMSRQAGVGVGDEVHVTVVAGLVNLARDVGSERGNHLCDVRHYVIASDVERRGGTGEEGRGGGEGGGGERCERE